MTKRVLITGVGRGLGLELATQAVAAGHEVFGTVRAGRHGGTDDIGLSGLVELDLADEDSTTAGAARLVEMVDGLDVVINNAGIDARTLGAEPTKRGPFDLSTEVISGVLDVNLLGVVTLTRSVLPLLRSGDAPLVLNISSQLGSLEQSATMGSDTAYNISKAALNMWTVKAAAALEPQGITMVCLHPGWVQTDMGGASASLTPEESAAAILQTAGGLTLADSGRFMRWDGSTHPW